MPSIIEQFVSILLYVNYILKLYRIDTAAFLKIRGTTDNIFPIRNIKEKK